MLNQFARKLTTGKRASSASLKNQQPHSKNDSKLSAKQSSSSMTSGDTEAHQSPQEIPFHQQDWQQLAVVQDSQILQKLTLAEIQRQQIIHELLLTEQQFCRDLFTIQWIHKELMSHATLWKPRSAETFFAHQQDLKYQSRKEKNISADGGNEAELAEQKAAFDLVFADIWPLIGLHEHFRDTLQQAYRKSPAYPACVRACRELAEKVLPLFLQPYEEYCVHYNERVSALQKLMNDNARFRRLLAQVVSDRGRGWTAEVLLHKPMQRLSQYHLLFQKIYQMTPETDDDYEAAVKMTGMLQTILTHLDGLKANLEMGELLRSFQQELLFKYAVTTDGRRKNCRVGREYRLSLPESNQRECVRQQLFYSVPTTSENKEGVQASLNKPESSLHRRLSFSTKQSQPQKTSNRVEPIQVFLLTDYLLIGRPVNNIERKKYARIKWIMFHMPVPLSHVSACEVPHPGTGNSSVLKLTVGKEVYLLRSSSATNNQQVISDFCRDLTRCVTNGLTPREPTALGARPLSSAASSFTSKVLRRSSLIDSIPATQSADHVLFQSFLDTSDMELCLETPCKIYYWDSMTENTAGKWVPMGKCRADIYEARVHHGGPDISILNAAQIGFLRIHASPDVDGVPLFTCKLAPYTRISFDAESTTDKIGGGQGDHAPPSKDFKATIVMTQCVGELPNSTDGPIQRTVVLRISDREMARQFRQRIDRFLHGSDEDDSHADIHAHFGTSLDLDREENMESIRSLNREMEEEVVRRSELENEKKPVVVEAGITSLDEIELQIHQSNRSVGTVSPHSFEREVQINEIPSTTVADSTQGPSGPTVHFQHETQPVQLEYPVMHVRKIGNSRHVYQQNNKEESAASRALEDHIVDASSAAVPQTGRHLDTLVFSDEEEQTTMYTDVNVTNNGGDSTIGHDDAMMVEDTGESDEDRFRHQDYQLIVDDGQEEGAPLLPGRDSSLGVDNPSELVSTTQQMNMTDPFELNQVQLWVDAAIDNASALYDQLSAVQHMAKYQIAISESTPPKLAHQIGFDLMDAVWAVLESKLSDTVVQDQNKIKTKSHDSTTEEYQSAVETGKHTLHLLRAEMDRMHRQVGRLETLLMQQHQQQHPNREAS